MTVAPPRLRVQRHAAGHKSVTRILLDAKASVTIQAATGMTAMDIAVIIHDEEVKKLITSVGMRMPTRPGASGVLPPMHPSFLGSSARRAAARAPQLGRRQPDPNAGQASLNARPAGRSAFVHMHPADARQPGPAPPLVRRATERQVMPVDGPVVHAVDQVRPGRAASVTGSAPTPASPSSSSGSGGDVWRRVCTPPGPTCRAGLVAADRQAL